MVLIGSCPWPGSWSRSYGAHLHLQAREDPTPTANAVPSTLSSSSKAELRRAARRRRAALAASQPEFAAALAQHIAALDIGAGTVVGGYRARKDEADPGLLLARLAEQGCAIAFPRVVAKDAGLEFHLPPPSASHGENLAPGAFGISEPPRHWPRATPSVLLVPLLAFDAHGHRLGYGGGYYDRTLAASAARAIGVAYAGQETAPLPREPHDRALDLIVTENGVRRFTRDAE